MLLLQLVFTRLVPCLRIHLPHTVTPSWLLLLPKAVTIPGVLRWNCRPRTPRPTHFHHRNIPSRMNQLLLLVISSSLVSVSSYLLRYCLLRLLLYYHNSFSLLPLTVSSWCSSCYVVFLCPCCNEYTSKLWRSEGTVRLSTINADV